MVEPGFKVALVGASSLKGKELKEVLEERRFPLRQLLLLDEEDLMGHLTEFRGEPTFIRPADTESFQSADFAFFASTPLFTRNYWKLAERQGAAVIDLSEALEEDATQARLAAPFATGSLPPGEGKVFIAAHPAALAMALILRRLVAQVPVARAIINVFEPASERGAAGVEEQHKQAVALLSFHDWPREVFDSQVAFNLLAAYGEGARPALIEVENRLRNQLGQLLGPGAPPISMRVIHGGSFHSHSFSFYLELQEERTIEQIENALAGEGFDLRRAGHEAPSAVGAATSNEVLVGDIRRDSVSPRGCWLWAAADNLRLMALNAVRIAEESSKVRAA